MIWLNGTFGAGKTATAYLLQSRLPHAYVFDPENAGFYLRQNLPEELKAADFQDEPLWREMNLRMLEKLAREYDGEVIVPMTLAQPAYFDQLVGGLREKGVEVQHFVLSVTEETLRHRLHSRLESKKSWAYRQADRCLPAMARFPAGEQVICDHKSADQAAEEIAERCGLTLSPRKSAWHTFWFLQRVKFGHMR